MSGGLTRVEISSVAAGGDGVGRTEGMVVFVPRTAPGDVANVRLTPSKRFGRGLLASLEASSPLRVDPPCPHYTEDRCGGCQLQHLSYSAQLSAKGAMVGDALRRIGRREVADPQVVPSDAEWRYRRKLTLHLRRGPAGWIAGLHPYDDPVAVFDLLDCPITEKGVVAVWGELRPAFDLLPHERALRVSVRLVGSGASVVVEGGTMWRAAETFLARVPSVTELWWKADGRGARLVAERRGSSGAGAAFAQVNARVAAALTARLLARVRHFDPRRVVDAYAGSGGTAVPLAEEGRAVVAIELDRAAVSSFADALRPPSRAIAGRVEEHLAAALPADVVILNPPRSGADARVTAALQSVSSPPRALFYVSCDPATLGRDLARMPRYRLADVRAFDMFPQTAHVETVCELVPEAA